MQAGSLSSNDVMALTSTVLVNGVVRAHEEWSIDREIVGDLPEQVVAGGGIRQATGSVTWADQQDVTDMSANPWNESAGWLPKRGEQVVIYASDGVTSWPQFVGVIDETTGGQAGMQSTIIDWTDYLNKPFNHQTVLRLHPPKSEGEDFMGVGMTPGYVIDRLFRTAGFYATPPQEPNCAVNVPLQTSSWPHWGRVVSAGSATGGAVTHGLFYRTPWGYCMSDFLAVYEPAVNYLRTDPFQLTCMVAAEHAGSFTLDAEYGVPRLRLWINPTRQAVALWDGVEVCRLTIGAAATTVTLLVKAGNWTLKDDLGGTALGTYNLPAGDALSHVILNADANSRIAGVQVSKPTAASEFQSLSHVPNFFQETGILVNVMDVLPSIVDRTVIDVLTDISKASLSPFWFDESGKPVMYGSDVLMSRPSVQTVTTLDDITKLSWTDSRLGMRSSVSVKYRYPAMNRSKYANVLLWQGSGETMESGQEKSLFAKEPADEDWVEIDNFTVSNAGGLTAFNQGRGTWVQSYLEDSAGAWTVSTGYVTWSPIQTVDDETKLFNVAVGTLPAGKSLVLGTPDDASNYFPRMRGLDMPVLRGRAKVKWSDMTLTAAQTGPAGFPALEHDAGVWSVRTEGTLIQTRIADFIAAQVTSPSPVITGMEVIYDPRRQLGDVITIKSEKLLGIELTALIVGVRNSAGSSFTQSLDVRIITKKSLYTTYAEYDKTLPNGLTYAQWQALGPLPETYQKFNDPA